MKFLICTDFVAPPWKYATHFEMYNIYTYPSQAHSTVVCVLVFFSYDINLYLQPKNLFLPFTNDQNYANWFTKWGLTEQNLPLIE